MTLVFFYSILKNGTSEAVAVASHKSQAVIKKALRTKAMGTNSFSVIGNPFF